MIIRPLVEADLRSIEALLGEEPDALFAAQYHPMHGPDRDGELWRRSRVAVSPDGNVVGAISVLRNPSHSGRFSVSLEVRPDHRRQGIGTALVEVARGLRSEPLPLSAKAHTTDLAAMALLQAVGGRIYQQCPGRRPDPTSPEIRSWAGTQAVPGGVRLDPLNGVTADALAVAWVAQYLWSHEAWSPVTSPDTLAQRLREGLADLDPATSTGAWIGDELVATNLVLREPDGAVTLVAETIRRDQPDGVRLVAAALARCMTLLGDAAVTNVLIDGHESDLHLAPVLATLPPTPAEPLLLVEIP